VVDQRRRRDAVGVEEEQPLTLGALGAGVARVIGRGLPRGMDDGDPLIGLAADDARERVVDEEDLVAIAELKAPQVRDRGGRAGDLARLRHEHADRPAAALRRHSTSVR
jgi:hypothetical protein